MPFGVGKKDLSSLPACRSAPEDKAASPLAAERRDEGQVALSGKEALKAVWSEAAGLKEVLPTKNGGPQAPSPATYEVCGPGRGPQSR